MAAGFLMYHELERPGRPLCETEPGYVRYVLDEWLFREQLAWMASRGLRGCSLGQAHAAGLDAPRQVVITFDDGCETDWLVAAPLLVEHDFGATFYVVSRWIDRRGFLTAAQVRQLAAAGFEIGSHSATHAFLTELDDAALRRELVDSKREIEDVVGAPVAHLSCPGGRWSRRVAELARDAGYATVATSRAGLNGAAADPYALKRFALLRHTAPRTFAAFATGKGLAAIQARERVLAAAKALLGTQIYERLRGSALGDKYVQS